MKPNKYEINSAFLPKKHDLRKKLGYNQALSDYDAWLGNEEAIKIVANILHDNGVMVYRDIIAKGILSALREEK